jgi:hypothetical protein
MSGIDLQDFGPALYDGQPWLIDVGTHTSAGADVQVASHGYPLIISGSEGKGKVVMSGLNLPFHSQVYSSDTGEADLLGRLIRSVQAEAAMSTPNFQSVIHDADSASVDLENSGATGVLFKEQDYPDWHAYASGQGLPIYPAGPNMMYVVLPAGEVGTVNISYQLSDREVASSAISVLTAVGLLLFVLVPVAYWRRIKRGMRSTAIWRRSTQLIQSIDLIP